MADLITGDDLDAIAHGTQLGEDPLTVAAALVAVVDEGRLAELADTPHALTLAAEQVELTGDLETAIALVRRAVASDHRQPWESGVFAKTYLAHLLLQSGEEHEGMAILTDLRPVMATDPLDGVTVAEVLELTGREALSVEWLTSALVDALDRDERLTDDHPDAASTSQVVFELATHRHRLREELGLDHDKYDELADMLEEELDAPVPLVFWPRADFESLTDAWPGLAAEWEPTWDVHRALLETSLQRWSAAGHQERLVLLGSAAELAAVAQREGVADLTVEVEQDYLEELLESPTSVEVEWPPARNGDCWCGSGAKYKKCCLPRGRT